MVKNKENVARAIFSPRMIVDGEIQPETISSGIEQDFLLLAIQRELVDIAQKGLREL